MTGSGVWRATPAAAFTLIELILVLTLLAILTSLAAPSLSSFFRGRALDSEARQLLSLTHAGQSRAVSDGFPMLLWFDSQAHAYGLVEETASPDRSSQDADPKAENFDFDDSLQIEPVRATARQRAQPAGDPVPAGRHHRRPQRLRGAPDRPQRRDAVAGRGDKSFEL